MSDYPVSIAVNKPSPVPEPKLSPKQAEALQRGQRLQIYLTPEETIAELTVYWRAVVTLAAGRELTAGQRGSLADAMGKLNTTRKNAEIDAATTRDYLENYKLALKYDEARKNYLAAYREFNRLSQSTSARKSLDFSSEYLRRHGNVVQTAAAVERATLARYRAQTFESQFAPLGVDVRALAKEFSEPAAQPAAIVNGVQS
ncbi:MAG TPA: hypothetical protein VMG59_06880 [Phycisphaerae bacterium]|nr:hypothetical protein [Phycisphaerae bacterium]